MAKTTTRYFVRRTHPETGRVGFTGPLPASRVDREAQAWKDAGWAAEVAEATPEVRAEVRAWERAKATR